MRGLPQTIPFIEVFWLSTRCCKIRANSVAQLELFLGQKNVMEGAVSCLRNLVVLLLTPVFPKGREKEECTGPGSISRWEVKEVQGTQSDVQRSSWHTVKFIGTGKVLAPVLLLMALRVFSTYS